MSERYLFRGKTQTPDDSKYSKWISGQLTHYKERDRTAGIDGTAVHTRTVGQYTGLRDIKGTLIFEGDIVKWGHMPKSHENPNRIAKVIMNPDIQFAVINYECPPFRFGSFAYKDTENHLEVIGNIHDNPELLS